MKLFFYWMKRSEPPALPLDGEARCGSPIGLNTNSLDIVLHFHLALAGEVISTSLIG